MQIERTFVVYIVSFHFIHGLRVPTMYLHILRLAFTFTHFGIRLDSHIVCMHTRLGIWQHLLYTQIWLSLLFLPRIHFFCFIQLNERSFGVWGTAAAYEYSMFFSLLFSGILFCAFCSASSNG